MIWYRVSAFFLYRSSVLPRGIETFIYIMCRSLLALFYLKVSKCHLSCRCYLPTIAPIQRYLKTSSLHVIPTLPTVRRRAVVCAFRPPRRLSPRFPRRFSRRLPIVPPACRLHQLHTARVDFSERSSCRSSDVVPVSSVPARRSCMPMHIAFGRHIVPRNHIASRRPCRLAVPIWRRLVCLVAWLREGREGRA